MNEEIENARITNVTIGYDDHGCLHISIYLEGDAWGQGIQCLCGKAGDGFMEKVIQATLHALDEASIDSLKGKIVRIKRRRAFIRAVGHPLKNQWMDLDAMLRDRGGTT